MQFPGNAMQCNANKPSLYLFRWRQFAREEDSVQGPRQLPILRKRPPLPQERPPRDLNAPTAGKLTQMLVQASNASNMEVTHIMPPMQKKLARLKGVIWRLYTLGRSKTSSCKRSTLKIGSGLDCTVARTEHSNGLMGPLLTSSTGCLVSLMDRLRMTTYSWTVSIVQFWESGTICTTAKTIITFASLPCELPND